MYNGGIKYNFDSETSKETVKTSKEMEYKQSAPVSGVVCSPIYECPEERVIHREFIHEVPHVCPVNTRIINHHIYKHTYSPCYTCCEENEICNVTEGCCNNF